ncbi:growth-regulating factor 7 [Lactuca sativa]|uniref:Growth-regulating factor n=1 Tax=Lactuca sativa TaxID=4236 RepID=A0A9R1XPI5_LACSA|nr:growth-regulating factor 7 [Lactuca sativa]KAJ0214877.1 hypothetical protein LSAT_V11C300134040 [Lactuca sativa]
MSFSNAMDFSMSNFSENPNNNHKIHESWFLNHKRSDPDPHLDQRPIKTSRPDPYNTTMSMSMRPSFKNENQMSLLSSYHTPPAYIENGGPFTPSQWMELEHQALIYKYLVANVPVPSLLINHIKKSLDPFVFSGSSSTSNAPSLYGWGGFRLGFPANNDPEPGRCRRTDGKKWRCSKEAVPDQKYCEKHINRGRHRSRKLVEGNNGAPATDGGGGINNQFKNLQLQPQNGSMNRPEEHKPQWNTQLTMSMDSSSDFSSSSNSIPDSWKSSMGGPLGEALKTSNGGNSNRHSWCSYSPTGVFSRSNSSSGSSPRGNQEDGGGDEMLFLTHAVTSASFQSSK